MSAAWGHWKKCGGVLCDRKMPLKLKGKTIIQNSGTASIGAWCKDMGYSNKPIKSDVDDVVILMLMCGVKNKDINSENNS